MRIFNKRTYFKSIITFFAIAIISSCSTELKPTSVSIKDEIRHYYPIMTGKKLLLSYEIENTGKEALIISEIQTTCGCITKQKDRMIIPEGQKSILNFEFDSSKNIGYVENEILLYGNFDSTSVYKLYFDINVIPHTDYTKDYEELYEDYSKNKENSNNRKYYYTESEINQ